MFICSMKINTSNTNLIKSIHETTHNSEDAKTILKNALKKFNVESCHTSIQDPQASSSSTSEEESE
jgi:hypothetical protein